MKEKTRDGILSLIMTKLRNDGIYSIFDFENIQDYEFKKTYGFTKKQIIAFINGEEIEE